MSRYNQCKDCEHSIKYNYDVTLMYQPSCTIKPRMTYAHDSSDCEEFEKEDI